MMRHRQRISGVLIALMLGCAAARADDARNPTEPPDPGFLEFLGSVDRLADVNPDYLSDSARAPKPGDKSAQTPAPPPKPAPPRQALPPSASAPGVPKNE